MSVPADPLDRTAEDAAVGAGIYVHVPFCLTRCGYCDFNAHAGLDPLKTPYVRALEREADLVSDEWGEEGFVSVFVGGGTPTTLEAPALDRLLSHVRSRFDVDADAEVTIEANPDTVDEHRFRALLAAGYSRVSMGAQSFDPASLEALERIHSPDAVRRAFDAARSAGYRNLNVDLIYGADGESLESWRRTLEQAIDLAPEHISAYALTIEPATPLGRKVEAGAVAPPDPDAQADMFLLACELLDAAGFGHYEVSNWARPGFECRHNLGYWERRPYLGLGAGAHSYRDRRRWWNVRPPDGYIRAVEAGEAPVGGDERLDPQDDYLEEVFLRMRTLQGIPGSWVDDDRAEGFLEAGLLERRGRRLVPTERGMLLLNEIVLSLTA